MKKLTNGVFEMWKSKKVNFILNNFTFVMIAPAISTKFKQLNIVEETINEKQSQAYSMETIEYFSNYGI